MIARLALVAVLAAAVLRVGDLLPPAQFIDQAGRPFSFQSWRGKFVVIAFIYTRCPDPRECPLTSAKFAQLQNRLGSNSRLAEITLDPAYDRPKILAAYAKTFGFRPGRVTLLTGDSHEVLDFAAKLGASARKDPTLGFVHNESTVVVDPQGKIAELIGGGSWKPDEIASVIAHYGSAPKWRF
jgi:protein SCO1/2